MTTPTTSPISGPYIADGVNRDWDFNFLIRDAAHLLILVSDDAIGTNSVEYDSGDGYSIPDSGDIGNSAGGTVRFPVAPTAPLAAGKYVVILSNVPYQQGVALANQGGYYPETVEEMGDVLNLQIKQVAERVGRGVTAYPGQDPDAFRDSLFQAVADAQAQVTLAAAQVSAATTQAGLAAAQVTLAATQVTLATAAKDAAVAAKVAAEAAAGAMTTVPVQTNAASNLVSPADADLIPVVSGTVLWKTTWANIKATIWTALGALINAGTVKATPVDADSFPIKDSASSNATKQVSMTALWANYLKGKADALYQPVKTILTTLGNLANAAGVLTNDGGGVLSWAAPSAGGRTLLATLTTTSGTTQDVTGIAAGYSSLYVEFDNVTFTTSPTMTLALSSTNGAAWGAAGTFATASGNPRFGSMYVDNISSTIAASKVVRPTIFAGGDISAPNVLSTNTAAAVNAIRFGGGTFSTGTIRVYGVK